MIRINVIVEGNSEEGFVRDVLAPVFGEQELFLYPCKIATGKQTRGGFRLHKPYDYVRRDLVTWHKQQPDSLITTMFDLYALPHDFPGVQQSVAFQDPFAKVAWIEQCLKADISQYIDPRKFIPYIQLHEFEALLFAEPAKLAEYFFEHQTEVEKLIEIRNSYASPEHINYGFSTAPSKRIIQQIPLYQKQKSIAGPIVAGYIGLGKLRRECRHFDEWLQNIENLGRDRNR